MAPSTPRPPLYIRMHESDNVAIVANDGGLPPGTMFPCGLTLCEQVPQGHKVALTDLGAGAPVRRYNVTIGRTIDAIPAGSWVNEFKIRMPEPPSLSNLPVATRRPEPMPAL